jgi:hypothetical protein
MCCNRSFLTLLIGDKQLSKGEGMSTAHILLSWPRTAHEGELGPGSVTRWCTGPSGFESRLGLRPAYKSEACIE